MNRRLRFAIFTITAALWMAAPWLAAPAAQFETPNRQFHQKTAFKLEGRHLAVSCDSCHLNGVFKGTPSKCIDCHWIRRQDDRFKLQLGSQCEECHTPASWTAARFDHASATGTPLNGAHRLLTCQNCHKGDNFRTADNACASCHLQDYQSAREPNHVASGFPTTCEACHRAGDSSFNLARFDHQASFPLVGQHATQTCASCHKNNVFQGTPRDCIGCHRPDYDRTTSPAHAAAGFPTTCESCHRPSDSSFRGVTFNHNTAFPLVGQHAAQTCASCHKNSIYRGTARDCVGCHRTEYDRTTAPAHAAAGFPTSCDACHRPSDSAFRGANFNHATAYPLVGQHATQTCVACHKNSVYRGTSRTCVGCHQADYNRTTAPAHASAGFSTACESCHRQTDTSFRGAVFSHAAIFPLVGQHAQQTCVTCHKSGVYRGTARTCVGCHQAAYNSTTSPPHASSGFSTSCETCHRDTDPSFRGVTFSHAAIFPLNGRHAQTTCVACHKNNVYRGTARTCVGCHQAQYNGTTSPPHASAGFSTSCETCHRDTDPSFRGAVFNHSTTFALLGKHAAAPCATCHVNNVYRGTSRTCAGCHIADYNRTTAPAHAATGFSTTCENCHRGTDGAWTQGVFSHKFPIASGRHKAPCVQCHTTPSYVVFTCLTCHKQSETDSEHRGRNGYRYDSLACYSCHPNGRDPVPAQMAQGLPRAVLPPMVTVVSSHGSSARRPR